MDARKGFFVRCDEPEYPASEGFFREGECMLTLLAGQPECCRSSQGAAGGSGEVGRGILSDQELLLPIMEQVAAGVPADGDRLTARYLIT